MMPESEIRSCLVCKNVHLFTILLIELKGITGVEKGLENFNELHWKLAGV